MGKTFGNKHSAGIVRIQLHRMPLQKGRRALPDIDGHIEYAATQAAYQFRFGRRRCLEMHAANRARLCRIGNIDLREM